jgi:hypothetical protein
MLRGFLIAYGIFALLVAAFLLFVAQAPVILALYLGASGVVIVGGILFERKGYRPRVDRTRGRWQATGERFVDPTTGKLMEVRYNPDTGQRDYVESTAPGQPEMPPS